MARGWKGEPGRHGLAAKGIKTGNRSHLEPLVFTEPVNKLHRLAKKYKPRIGKESVVFMATRNPASFFYDLTEEMPLNAQTRKDSDKMTKLAMELN